MNSTSLITVAWGNQYKIVIPRWWHYIERIRIKPDEIIIAHHPDDDTGVRELVEQHKDYNIKLVECYERNYAKMANTAIEAVTSEWFIPIGFDDFLYPNALDFQKIVKPDVDIVLASRDVTRDNIFVETREKDFKKFNRMLQPTANWASLSKGFEDHRVFHNSPIRKSLWKRLGGYPDYIIADWAFFLIALQNNVKVQHWCAVTILQYCNPKTLSQSEEAYKEIADLRKSMGLE
jgi:hypothetical protein